jgi:hypothetical protein
MSIKILEETFSPATADASEVGEFYAERVNGSVQVDLGRGNIVTAWAHKYEDGDIFIFGFMGRYIKGNKDWRVSMRATTFGNGERGISAYFGRDDRVGRFHKMNGIFWAPDKFFA